MVSSEGCLVRMYFARGKRREARYGRNLGYVMTFQAAFEAGMLNLASMLAAKRAITIKMT